MIEYPSSVVMSEHQMEIVQNRERDFPYNAMVAELTRYPGHGTPWHWHDHFEVSVVYSGTAEILTQKGRLLLHEGEGYFINANVLHLCRAQSADARACMHSQLFTRSVLSGTGLVARRYIAPVENCVDLEAVKLVPDVPSHARLLNAMKAAFDAAKEDAPGYEIFVTAHLCSFWGELFALVQPELARAQGQPREDAIRAKAMLSFIYENYAQPISVRQIADAAGICERECFRCFNQMLGTTPMLYLTQHRVAMAARALAETHVPVGEIAEQCGFSNSSYFGKVFRQIMNCTPMEYRKQNS